MYLPRHFTVTDTDWIAAFVDAAATATLVTFDGTRPVATLLPVIWERPDASEPDASQPDASEPGASGPGAAAGYGRLLGHIAIANDQWQTAAPGAQALAIVTGPQAYISPSWYQSTAEHGRTVPTWNYEVVHLTGDIAFHRDPEWLRSVVTRLTRRHEAGRQHPWAVSDAPPDYVDSQLRAIVGVELTVTSVEAKQKLSQNRSLQDRAGVVAGLAAEPGAGSGAGSGAAAAIAEAMAAQLGDELELPAVPAAPQV
ncbi:MAG: FMN-binding negative transcriptional regulator [Actinobacteria bacterium]|nr:FMN-binding negative transcriptional regulator [Actinomycetota bacterium]